MDTSNCGNHWNRVGRWDKTGHLGQKRSKHLISISRMQSYTLSEPGML